MTSVDKKAKEYQSSFTRDMGLWQNLALGFTYLSPAAGIYTMFGSCLVAGGPAMIWSLVLAGMGQFMVALVFGEIVSQYPLSGGIYPWSRHLYGKKWAWMSCWIYIMALFSTIAGVSYGAAPYILYFFNITISKGNVVFCSGAVLLFATIINFLGTKAVARLAIFGFLAEMTGTLFVSFYLLIFYRHQDLNVFFHSFGSGNKDSWLSAFAVASLIGIFQYYGFEACGDVAEEVKNPEVEIPKAMRYTLYIGGGAATFLCLALTLSVNDFQSVINGSDVDPVTTIFNGAFGFFASHLVTAVILISFVSCVMSLQTAASRVVYSYARDNMMPYSRFFSVLSKNKVIPPYALALTVLIPYIVILFSIITPEALNTIVLFSSVGMYIAFQMVIFAALRARVKGWEPAGDYRLGRWGLPVNIAALFYGVVAIIILCWPMGLRQSWINNWIVLLSACTIIFIGSLYLFFVKKNSL